MTARSPSARLGLRLLLALLLLATAALCLGTRFHAAMVALRETAMNVLIDELVDSHRNALIHAGDAQALYRNWFDLRHQFVIESVQARRHGRVLLVRVRLTTAPSLAAKPAQAGYYTLTPREDDAWEIAPLPRWWQFWLA